MFWSPWMVPVLTALQSFSNWKKSQTCWHYWCTWLWAIIMAEDSLHALHPAEHSWDEKLTDHDLSDGFAYVKEQGLGEDDSEWQWIIRSKLSFPRRQQLGTGTCFHMHTSLLLGQGKDLLKGLWAEFLWRMSDSAYRHQLCNDSHAF